MLPGRPLTQVCLLKGIFFTEKMILETNERGQKEQTARARNAAAQEKDVRRSCVALRATRAPNGLCFSSSST